MVVADETTAGREGGFDSGNGIVVRNSQIKMNSVAPRARFVHLLEPERRTASGESTVTAVVRQSRRYRQPRSSTASDASLSVRIVSAIWSCSPVSSWLLRTLLGRFVEAWVAVEPAIVNVELDKE